MGGETHQRDKESERDQAERLLGRRPGRCGKASEVASRAGEGESARPREAWRNVRLVGVPTPISRVSLTPISALLACPPTPTQSKASPGSQTDLQGLLVLAAASLQGAIGKYLGMLQACCWSLEIGLGGSIYTTEIGKHYRSGLCFLGWFESQFTTSIPLPGSNSSRVS